MTNKDELRLKALGGIGTFGGNSLILQDVSSSKALVVDCGIRFLHDDDAPGFDFALPDLESIRELGDSLSAYIITHGHLDHIGALPFAYETNPAPIFATPFTAALIRHRFAEHKGRQIDLQIVEVGDQIELSPFRVRWTAVSHSIPDASALVIDTPAGRVIHSGDFRVDPDPVVGPPTDLDSIRALAKDQSLCLIADSTLIANDQPSPGEKSVIPALETVMGTATGRVVVTTFAHHIQRIAAILEVCAKLDRYLFLVGRSLLRSIDIARQRNLLPHTERIISTKQIGGYMPHQICGIVSGCQGERHGSLARMAANELPQASLEAGDCVIFSCRSIPGNERAIARVTDAFSARSIRCFNGNNGRHVSGHGSWPDLRLLLDAAKPKIFIAAHGGDTQLLNHRIRVANGSGSSQSPAQPSSREGNNAQHSPDHILPLQNGQSAIIYQGGITNLSKQESSTPTLYTQGQHMTDTGPKIAVSRRRMNQKGVLVLWLEHGKWRIKARGVSPGFKPGVLTQITAIVSAHDAAHHRAPNEDELNRMIGKYLRSVHLGKPEIILAHDTANDMKSVHEVHEAH
jgi:ribonuclease J